MKETGRDRRAVLKEINDTFRRYGLPVWDSLNRIGKWRQEEFEFTGVIDVWDSVVEYFVIVRFGVIKPDGNTGVYAIRFNRPGAVVMLIVNKKVILAKQHRPAVGGWPIDCIRGWLPVEPAWEPENEFAPTELILKRELGDEFVASLKVEHHKRFVSAYEDNGTRGTAVGLHLVIGKSEVSVPKQKDFLKFKTEWSWEEFLEEYDKERPRFCNDLHSMGAISRSDRYIRANLDVRVLLAQID